MIIIDHEILSRQFGAAIDMLGNAIRDCPDEPWEERPWKDRPGQWVAAGFSKFWYLSYHACAVLAGSLPNRGGRGIYAARAIRLG